MQPATAIEGDTEAVVFAWLRGVPIADIAADNAMSIEAMSKYIEEYISYLLPWGISAYLRIARHTLEIAPSRLALGLPGMMKYGVPLPEAAWAYAAGIASRQAAIALAEGYAGQADVSTPIGFRRWLAELDPLTLAEEYELAGEILDLTTTAVVRSRRNTLLPVYEAGDFWPHRTRVRVHRAVDPAAARTVTRARTPLTVHRDYSDRTNRNSLVVAAGELVLGNLPWHLSTVLAPEVDAGLRLQAQIEGASDDEGRVYIDVTLAPYEVEQAITAR
jgi:hypothetical protein